MRFRRSGVTASHPIFLEKYPRMWRTDLRPISNLQAISNLLTPAQCTFRIAATGGPAVTHAQRATRRFGRIVDSEKGAGAAVGANFGRSPFRRCDPAGPLPATRCPGQ